MKRKLYLILLIVWSIVIFTVSSIPSLKVPSVGHIFGIDKIAHFLEYFILASLLYKVLAINSLTKKKIVFTLLLTGLVIPGIDELHQNLIPGRLCSIYDYLADVLGFSIVILIIALGKRNKNE